MTAIAIILCSVGIAIVTSRGIISLHKLKQPPKSKKDPPGKPDHSKPPNRWIR